MNRSRLGFLGDLKGDIQAKVDENLRLAGSALATNNLRNAKQFAQAALSANAPMLSVDPVAFQANNDLGGKILQQVTAAENPGSPPATSPDAPSATAGFFANHKKLVIGTGVALAVVGLAYFVAY